MWVLREKWKGIGSRQHFFHQEMRQISFLFPFNHTACRLFTSHHVVQNDSAMGVFPSHHFGLLWRCDKRLSQRALSWWSTQDWNVLKHSLVLTSLWLPEMVQGSEQRNNETTDTKRGSICLLWLCSWHQETDSVGEITGKYFSNCKDHIRSREGFSTLSDSLIILTSLTPTSFCWWRSTSCSLLNTLVYVLGIFSIFVLWGLLWVKSHREERKEWILSPSWMNESIAARVYCTSQVARQEDTRGRDNFTDWFLPLPPLLYFFLLFLHSILFHLPFTPIFHHFFHVVPSGNSKISLGENDLSSLP